MRNLWNRFLALNWKWKTGIVAGVLIVIAAAASSSTEEAPASGEAVTATGTPTSSPTIAATAEPTSPTSTVTASPEPSVETVDFAEFDASTIAVRLVKNEQLGGLAEVHFVDERPDVDLYDLALQCVYAELDEGNLGAFCYAFGSQGGPRIRRDRP